MKHNGRQIHGCCKLARQETCLPATGGPRFIRSTHRMSGLHHASAYTKDKPFLASIKEIRLLNKPGSGKETRHLVVDVTGSGLIHKPGDSLGILPSNRPSEVEELLQRLGATGAELVSPTAL